MIRKRLQLALIHVAVSMTFVPIQSTLNRVMIKELALSATLVALLTALPYLFSPIQVMIGSFSDRHPLWGRRRTPYILLGLGLCVAGLAVSPFAAYVFESSWLGGLGLSLLAFGAWGMGFNFAAVSYLSLASELSGEKGRARTIAIMFFMMIVSIILTAYALSKMLEIYSPALLVQAFITIAGVALALGLIGVVGLEDRASETAPAADRLAWGRLFGTLTQNRQAMLFFIYLVLLLAAILGQDILLEPFAGTAFNMPVNETTRITSIWGTCTLVCLLIAGALEGRVNKRLIVALGSWGAAAAYGLIILSGFMASRPLFYIAISALGLATGLATVSNLSLMLDMTLAERVGLFIGAWGMADAMARLVGNVLSGVLRDAVTHVSQNALVGYTSVFGVQALMLAVSLVVLRAINISAFQSQAKAAGSQPSVVERAAMVID